MPPSPYRGDCANEPCRNDSGAGQEAQECAHSRNGLPATDWLEFGSFAPNEINYSIRAKLLPFDLLKGLQCRLADHSSISHHRDLAQPEAFFHALNYHWEGFD